jgi:hypothetical protein
MKRIVAVISFLCYLVCSASTVEWGTLTIDKYSDGSYYCTAWPLYMDSHRNGDTMILAGSTYDNLAYASLWVEVFAGDVITGQGLYENETSYFAYANHTPDWEPIELSDYSVSVRKGESTYLAVALDIAHEGREFWTGWMELTVDENGDVVALNSAFDRSGGPLIVGAIPEPTSGMFLIFGLTVLGLRRRNINRGMRPSYAERKWQSP